MFPGLWCKYIKGSNVKLSVCLFNIEWKHHWPSGESRQEMHAPNSCAPAQWHGTGFATGHTQLAYESQEAASGQRGEKWEQRSEFQSNSAGMEDIKDSTPASQPWSGPNLAKILCRTSRIHPGSLQGGGVGSFPSCVATKLFITFHLLRK